ncbi:TRAP-type C4-dicarboxylate transport system, substrate-binding protein [Anaerobranca californiensis DSM 14826]|jgi:TRAP-type C4-dicarboxylate transport system substrate-binding protein|uniref:TRAP-type C4-dicarboxylate transport system, substrate-binding protein n=1 Tax=Anaerobranca californiensis DSM 14826 TaxID=1120989 RepID=A0A1M6RCN9_9FIRM|nr:C4-dicarboxylate TRAP transporter substrate-binding protein [Anaerobranca californiensis]SHK30255.1 TRAP-type C4-dicarboxylate transport system, substrate-binding protein [Anaerobranca californiensis DSM 14826]
MSKGFKLLSLTLILLLLTFSIVGCGQKESEKGGEDDFKIVLRLSHVFNPAEQLTKSMDWVAERIYERTNGAVEIQTFPQGQLAVYKDGVEQVVRGANFISVEDPTYIGDYVPDFVALVGPFLYDSYDEYVEMVRTELVQDMIKRAEEKGIKILALDYIFGFRNVISDKVITTPDDMKGLKIRTPASQLFVDTFNSLGAIVTPLPWGETLSALQQGVVDAIEGSEFTNIGNKVYEIKKNVAVTQHFLGTCGVYISTKVWDTIPEKYQKIIEEEFEKGAAEMINILKSNHSNVVKELESYGVKFNEVDKESFRQATKHIYETFPGLTPGIYDQLQEELKVIRERLN